MIHGPDTAAPSPSIQTTTSKGAATMAEYTAHLSLDQAIEQLMASPAPQPVARRVVEPATGARQFAVSVPKRRNHRLDAPRPRQAHRTPVHRPLRIPGR
ncbi:hypothetical protein [Nocardia goodfellowii]|uniref:Uncharacterized protein n=1 Tax=Nocardia goodfellowii TaxID=882446 RepID=A0ABS4QS12_9NOCA|nr:hypothetical protein [Nocardia goodfellowii]MBP2194479.1 hypothetical protein [Nocardia goodfellowii]